MTAEPLATELADARARIAELESAPLIVWRACYRDAPFDGFTIGTFRSEPAARAACEDHVRCEQGAAEATITWWADAEDPDEPRELAVTLPGAAKAFATGYAVMPVQVQDQYDPEADR